MNTLLEDIIQSIEQVPDSITGIPNLQWVTSHIFYGNPLGKLGTGGQNRGRCPFVRVFRTGKDFDYQAQSDRGGTVTSNFTIEIVTRQSSVKSQESNWDFAYRIWESIITDLREKDNYMIGDERVLEMQVDPVLFVLQCQITVENTYNH